VFVPLSWKVAPIARKDMCPTVLQAIIGKAFRQSLLAAFSGARQCSAPPSSGH